MPTICLSTTDLRTELRRLFFFGGAAAAAAGSEGGEGGARLRGRPLGERWPEPGQEPPATAQSTLVSSSPGLQVQAYRHQTAPAVSCMGATSLPRPPACTALSPSHLKRPPERRCCWA